MSSTYARYKLKLKTILIVYSVSEIILLLGEYHIFR